MAAAFAQIQDKADEATNFYKAGMEANPTSLLLHYAYADSEERKSHNEECHKVYNGLIERLQSEIDSTNTAMQTDIKEALAEKERRDAMEKAARAGQNMMSGGYDEEIGEDVRIQERENIRKAITESRTERITELRRLAASVWIMQMRFARRAEVSNGFPFTSLFFRMRTNENRLFIIHTRRAFNPQDQSSVEHANGLTSHGMSSRHPLCSKCTGTKRQRSQPTFSRSA